MRHSVEPFGPQHPLELTFVAPDLAFYTCREFEARRMEFMRPLLQEYALVFSPRPFPRQYPAFEIGGRCYDQALLLSSSCRLIYCEGVITANTPDGPFYLPHAWCCTPSGLLIDPTSPKSQNRSEVSYVGIPFQRGFVHQLYFDWGFAGILDGHPDLGDSVGAYAQHPSVWLEPVHGLQRWMP